MWNVFWAIVDLLLAVYCFIVGIVDMLTGHRVDSPMYSRMGFLFITASVVWSMAAKHQLEE